MTHKQRVLRLLSDRKPHSHHELYQLGCVAHSRISDLRRDGHTIKAWREGDLYLYQLVSSAGVLDEASAPSSRTGVSGCPAQAEASSSTSNAPNLRLSREAATDPSQDAPGTGDEAGVLSLFEAVA